MSDVTRILGRTGLPPPQPTPVGSRRQGADKDSAQRAPQDLPDRTLGQARHDADEVRPCRVPADREPWRGSPRRATGARRSRAPAPRTPRCIGECRRPAVRDRRVDHAGCQDGVLDLLRRDHVPAALEEIVLILVAVGLVADEVPAARFASRHLSGCFEYSRNSEGSSATGSARRHSRYVGSASGSPALVYAAGVSSRV